MRAYFFGNMYLSSIQQGIQAQHCIVEMFVKYIHDPFGDPNDEEMMLYEWAKDHKTSILLSGGGTQDLYEIQGLLSLPANPYPWSYFHEDELALQQALTCVGIILPERIYIAVEGYRQNDASWDYGLTGWEKKLCARVGDCPMAR